MHGELKKSQGLTVEHYELDYYLMHKYEVEDMLWMHNIQAIMEIKHEKKFLVSFMYFLWAKINHKIHGFVCHKLQSYFRSMQKIASYKVSSCLLTLGLLGILTLIVRGFLM